MITKGIIINKLIDSNKYIVSIPYLNEPGNNTNNYYEATLSSLPGSYDSYKKDDIVFIGFEDHQISKPVILGKLYLNVDDTYRGNISINSLEVKDKAVLPDNTIIGNITSDKLNSVIRNVDNLNKMKSSGGGLTTIPRATKTEFGGVKVLPLPESSTYIKDYVYMDKEGLLKYYAPRQYVLYQHLITINNINGAYIEEIKVAIVVGIFNYSFANKKIKDILHNFRPMLLPRIFSISAKPSLPEFPKYIIGFLDETGEVVLGCDRGRTYHDNLYNGTIVSDVVSVFTLE